MSKSRSQKTELLEKYREILKTKEGYFLVNSDKVDTLTTTELKLQLKNTDANFTVVKNSIFKVALQETEQPVNIQNFDGPTAIIYFNNDPTAPAKLIKEAQNKTELFDTRGGAYKGEFLTTERIMQLAEIPSRDILLSKLLGTISAPLSNFMNTMTGNIRGFTLVLKSISEKNA